MAEPSRSWNKVTNTPKLKTRCSQYQMTMSVKDFLSQSDALPSVTVWDSLQTLVFIHRRSGQELRKRIVAITVIAIINTIIGGLERQLPVIRR